MRLASKMATLYKETIDDSLNLLHHDTLQIATRMLVEARTIYCGTAGDALEMAETFKNRMIKIGKTVIVEHRNDNLFYAASQAPNDSCFILISYSGETAGILKVAEVLKKRGIPTLVITSFGDNTLSKRFETVIRLSTREKLVDNLGNFTSLLSIGFLFDVLYSSVLQVDYEKNYQLKTKLSHQYEENRKSSNPILED